MSDRAPRKSGRVTPKSTRPSPQVPATDTPAPIVPLEALQNILGDLDELRNSDPLGIEIRASFAWGIMQRNDGLELFRAVLATLTDGLRRGSPDARDYMRMLATVAETGVAKRFAQLLRQAAIIALPPRWVNHAGRAVVEHAYIYEYELGDTYTVNLICRYPDAERQHELVAFIDASLGWFADIGAFSEVSPIDDDLGEVHRREISLAEARAHIERALGFAPALFDHPDARKIVARLRLIAHYAESLPSGFELPERQPLTDDERDVIVDAFLASSHGQALIESAEFSDGQEVARDLVRTFVVIAHNILDGKPLRLTPQSMGLLSLALLSEEQEARVALPSGSDDEQVALMKQVMRAFVPYAHELNGWGDRYLADTLTAID
jgi:hypothetical protein